MKTSMYIRCFYLCVAHAFGPLIILETGKTWLTPNGYMRTSHTRSSPSCRPHVPPVTSWALPAILIPLRAAALPSAQAPPAFIIPVLAWLSHDRQQGGWELAHWGSGQGELVPAPQAGRQRLCAWWGARAAGNTYIYRALGNWLYLLASLPII